MSVSSILNLLHELNKIILFYSTSAINLVMNLHEFNILFTHTQNKDCLK
jgi:hypothetical protein